jgi:hypothetical protein
MPEKKNKENNKDKKKKNEKKNDKNHVNKNTPPPSGTCWMGGKWSWSTAGGRGEQGPQRTVRATAASMAVRRPLPAELCAPTRTAAVKGSMIVKPAPPPAAAAAAAAAAVVVVVVVGAVVVIGGVAVGIVVTVVTVVVEAAPRVV